MLRKNLNCNTCYLLVFLLFNNSPVYTKNGKQKKTATNVRFTHLTSGSFTCLTIRFSNIKFNCFLSLKFNPSPPSPNSTPAAAPKSPHRTDRSPSHRPQRPLRPASCAPVPAWRLICFIYQNCQNSNVLRTVLIELSNQYQHCLQNRNPP